MATTFGEFVKARRQARGLTLRAFCEKHGFDPGNVSRLERGLVQPPQDEKKLSEFALTLGLIAGTDDWQEFFDRAAALGREAIWLHTYGERFVDEDAGRPAGPPRMAVDGPTIPREGAIPATPEDFPNVIAHPSATV